MKPSLIEHMAATAEAPVGRGGRTASVARRSLSSNQVGLFGALVITCIVLSVLSPYFFQVQNWLNIGRAASYTGITAAITTLVIIGGGLDLSIAAVMAFSGCVGAQLLMVGTPWPIAVAAGLASGAGIGAINGFFITYVGVNALIVTIGTQFVVRGAAYFVVNSQELVITNHKYLFIGQGDLFGVPFPAILMILVFGAVGWMLYFTKFGKHVYAIGGSPGGAMARLAGIPINRRRMQTYILSGTIAALSGVVLAGFSGTGLAYAATGQELPIIAAVILGGTALLGGRGSIFGTLIGVTLLATISNGLTLLNVSNVWQNIVQGVALLLAVTVDEVRQKRRAR